jgi:hypothetical protein
MASTVAVPTIIQRKGTTDQVLLKTVCGELVIQGLLSFGMGTSADL